MIGDVRQPRGFTLIEVLIVVAVIGVVALAAAPAVNSFTGANARSAASEIAGASRYLFDTAALRHQTCRLVLDIDAREWWAECTTAAPGARRNQAVMGKDGVGRGRRAGAGPGVLRRDRRREAEVPGPGEVRRVQGSPGPEAEAQGGRVLREDLDAPRRATPRPRARPTSTSSPRARPTGPRSRSPTDPTPTRWSPSRSPAAPGWSPGSPRCRGEARPDQPRLHAARGDGGARHPGRRRSWRWPTSPATRCGTTSTPATSRWRRCWHAARWPSSRRSTRTAASPTSIRPRTAPSPTRASPPCAGSWSSGSPPPT